MPLINPVDGQSIKEYDTQQTAEIQEVTTQLAQTEAELDMRKKQVSIQNYGVGTTTDATLKVQSSNNSQSRTLELYNYSGVKSDGTHTKADGKETFVVHHYNDKDLAVLDYCGRDSTALILRMAYNANSSGHASAGEGYFARFERTVLYDTNYEYPANRTLFGAKQVDLFDIGLSSTKNNWVCAFHGRDNAKTSSLGQGYIQQPLFVYTYGTSSQQGNSALKIYSNSYGGNALDLQTRSLSNGYSLKVTHQSPTQAAVYIDNYSSLPGLHLVSRTDATVDLLLSSTVPRTGGFAVKIVNHLGATVGGLTSTGKGFYLTDTATGALKHIRINNGVLEVL